MNSNLKLVSIILPIRNEEATITLTLRSIVEQDYPHHLLEVILVDGMSEDETIQKALLVLADDPSLAVQVIDNTMRIVPTGLNSALRLAKGDIIIRVDGHTTLAPDYVSQCVFALRETDASNVGGKMNAVGITPFGKTVAAATSSPFGIGNARFHYSCEEEWVDTVYMGCWPKKVFYDIGLFDEELVRDQDDEFNYRLRKMGGKILLNQEIHSEYFVRSKPNLLWKQYFQYGFWKVRVLQKHLKQMSLRQFVPPAFVLSIIISLVLSVVVSWGWIPLIVIFGLYLTVNLFFSLSIALKKGWQLLGLLPVAFTIIHISYGSGFLAGLFKFANRWNDKTGKVPPWHL